VTATGVSAAADAVTGAARPVIDVTRVTKVYEMGETKVYALRGVDLQVFPGDMIAIMGSSGSGKSTLMNILGCLDVPSGGRYVLDGVQVDGLDRNRLADLRNQKLGFVFQGFNLLARTSAIENVELPLLYDRSHRWTDTKAMAAAALERVGLGTRLDHHPSELSGGQQQRVAIARALVTQPTLLLADEPTGNLDSHMTVEVMSLFQELNEQGITILIVTHEPDVAKYARRIVEVRDGHIIRDHPVAVRRSAAEDLRVLLETEPEETPPLVTAITEST
jgi:putative ABC transport system ATP-binding protein